MHILPQRRAKPTVSLVPLIDIMVMILIFFIITMVPRENRQAVTLVLAQSSEGEALGAQAQAIAVSLDAQGQVFLQGEPIDSEELIERLLQYRNQFGANWQPLFLFDQEAQWQNILDVMGWAAEAGIQIRQPQAEVEQN